MSTIWSATISLFPWGSLSFRSPRIFQTRAPGSTPVSWLEFGRKCCHFFGIVQTSFCIVFLIHAMSLNIDMNMIRSSKDSGVRPFKSSWIYLLVSRVEAPGNTSQMNRSSRAVKFNCSSNPCSFHKSCNFVAQFLLASEIDDARWVETFSNKLPNNWMDLDSRPPHTMWNLRTRDPSSWTILLPDHSAT